MHDAVNDDAAVVLAACAETAPNSRSNRCVGGGIGAGEVTVGGKN